MAGAATNRMMRRNILSLGYLTDSIPGAHLTGRSEQIVLGLAYDSREVQNGFLFVAIHGEMTDGNRFVQSALSAGAVAIVSEQPVPEKFPAGWIQVPHARKSLADISRIFYGDPSGRLKLAGITGTKGKTTTSYLVDSAFQATGHPSCMMGTIEYRIGSHVWVAERTTPESSDIQGILCRAVEAGCPQAVMEVSSHSLVLHRVKGISFHTACFTNLSHDHLDYHHNLENYFQAKSLLFTSEEIDGPTIAVLNRSDSWCERLRPRLSCATLTYGATAEADIYPRRAPENLNPVRMKVCTPQGDLEVESHLAGQGNVFNILAAIAVCRAMQIDDTAIVRGLANLSGIPGRLELIRCGQPFTVIVDYAHTEAALENLLHLARGLQPQKIITVFGCGGNRDRIKRPRMGKIAAAMSDLVIITNDNPRNESPEEIADEIESGVSGSTTTYTRKLDRREAIAEAIRTAQPSDVVLIAGKGHEPYQEFADGKVPFDDRQVAREMLQQKLEGSL